MSGKRLEEPVAWYGPIVMNTQEQLRHAFKELREGTFLDSRPLAGPCTVGVVTGERMDTSHENRERVSHAHLPRVVIVGGVSAASAESTASAPRSRSGTGTREIWQSWDGRRATCLACGLESPDDQPRGGGCRACAPRHRAGGPGDAFAAGAILALVSETMIPEAFHGSPQFNRLLLVVGFVALLILRTDDGFLERRQHRFSF
jgi:Pirin C-terminal cupin domain